MYPREYFDTFWRGDLKNEVFVIMSFAEEFQPIWEQAIRPAIEQDADRNLFAHRVDATTLTGSIVIEILEGIANAKLIFAEISICNSGKWKGQRNGNVMYEVGLAHAIRQSSEIIMVRSDGEEINFDLAGIKIQKFDPNDLGATRKIVGILVRNSLTSIDNLKGLRVENAIRSLDGNCLKLISTYGKSEAFHIHSPKNMGEILATLPSYDAVKALLSLGIIWCDVNPQVGEYAYHWTNFGIFVLSRLGYSGGRKT